MIKFKERFEKSQVENKKTNIEYEIAKSIVDDFLKSDHGVDLHKESKKILQEEDETIKNNIDF